MERIEITADWSKEPRENLEPFTGKITLPPTKVRYMTMFCSSCRVAINLVSDSEGLIDYNAVCECGCVHEIKI